MIVTLRIAVYSSFSNLSHHLYILYVRIRRQNPIPGPECFCELPSYSRLQIREKKKKITILNTSYLQEINFEKVTHIYVCIYLKIFEGNWESGHSIFICSTGQPVS